MSTIFIIGVIVTVITAIPVALQLRQHPRGLIILFFAEMWERFSYYGMRGLLIFFLTQHFLFDDKFAQGQYGAYIALVYLLPLIGGYLADHYLGTRKAVAFGALLLVAGHSTMAIEGPPATQILTYQGQQYVFDVEGRGKKREVTLNVDGKRYAFEAASDGGLAFKDMPATSPVPALLPKGSFELSVEGRDPLYEGIFYLALALIVMGVGFLKANISSLVGQLYLKEDPRRDSGFTLFYYGINLGSFWAAILCGGLGQEVGWWAGFGLAGIGMAAGYVIFVLGKPWLLGKGEPPDPVRLAKPALGPINLEWTIYLAAIAGLGGVWILMQRYEYVSTALSIATVVVLGYLGYFMLTKCTRAEAGRMILALLLISFSVVFFTLFNQGGSSLNQFAERNTVQDLFGVEITPAQTALFNSGFILFLAPIFAAIWAYLEPRRLDPNAPAKFGLGIIQISLGFFVLVWGAQNFAGEDFRVPMIFLVLAYLLHTTGELCVSPVGLSQMSKLSPPATLATIMATWFLGSSIAGLVSGFIAALTAAETVAGKVLDPSKALASYVDVFGNVALYGTAIGVGILVLSPLLGRLAPRETPASAGAAEPGKAH